MRKKKEVKRKAVDFRFKLLYCIGMIMIVAGHCDGGGINLLSDWFPYYGFHLGLFLFASGYFYKSKYENHIGSYIWKKIKSLIIPLLLWNVFYVIVNLILKTQGINLVGDITIEKVLIRPFMDGNQMLFNIGGWFVVPLFLIQIINAIAHRTLKKFKWKQKEWLIFAAYMCLSIFSIWLSTHADWTRGYNLSTPTSWAKGFALTGIRTLFMLPFYEMGIIYKEKLEKHDKLTNWKYFLIIFLIQVIVIIICKRPPTILIANGRIATYGYIIPYISGIIGIALWFRIARILEPIIGKNKIVNLIADNSYSIMINHIFGIFLLNLCYGLIQHFTPFLDKFNWHGLRSDVWYHYKPLDLTQSLIFYVIAGLSIPIIMQKIVNKTAAFARQKSKNMLK